MGYSHGTKWTDEMIEQEIRGVMKKGNLTSMPTHSQMDTITGNKGLSVATSKRGGTKYWADRLGLDNKPCESSFGHEYECECMNKLISLEYDCELTKARYPYDLIANGNIKIDAKSSNLYYGKNGCFYTFNLEKSMPTCDVYVCYCVKEGEIQRVYIIPSCVLSGKTQLSIGEVQSKYDRYIDAWEIIKQYDKFYKQFTEN